MRGGSGDGHPATTDVTIVGGGAAGVILAAHLLRAATDRAPVDLTIIERDRVVGPGLPYRTTDPLHTLNNVAGRMSAYADDADHLVHWALRRGIDVDRETFLPRAVYGQYLVDVLDTAAVPEGSSLTRVHGEVVDLHPVDEGTAVRTAEGATQRAGTVVLALGTPPPRPLPRYERLGERYLSDPWDPAVAGRLSTAGQVLLVGTGLTMVDLAVQAQRLNPGVHLVAVSRSGELPRAHAPRPLRELTGWEPRGRTLAELRADVRRALARVDAAGGDWREVVESVRVRANDLWHCLGDGDRRELVASLARTWDLHRHRMSPQMDALVAELIDRGTLHIAHPADVDLQHFDVVVNCTGIGAVGDRGWNPLVDALLQRGLARPDRLRLGLDLGHEGEVIDAHGSVTPGLYAVGAARKGVDWEATAVPDVRRQAARLAGHLLTSASHEHRPAALPA